MEVKRQRCCCTVILQHPNGAPKAQQYAKQAAAAVLKAPAVLLCTHPHALGLAGTELSMNKILLCCHHGAPSTGMLQCGRCSLGEERRQRQQAAAAPCTTGQTSMLPSTALSKNQNGRPLPLRCWRNRLHRLAAAWCLAERPLKRRQAAAGSAAWVVLTCPSGVSACHPHHTILRLSHIPAHRRPRQSHRGGAKICNWGESLHGYYGRHAMTNARATEGCLILGRPCTVPQCSHQPVEQLGRR